MLGRKLLINTRLQPGAKGARRKKPFKRFFLGRVHWFTALKGGVNEMISTEQRVDSKLKQNSCHYFLKENPVKTDCNFFRRASHSSFDIL